MKQLVLSHMVKCCLVLSNSHYHQTVIEEFNIVLKCDCTWTLGGIKSITKSKLPT